MNADLEIEEWRPIAGAENFYCVSNLGRIRSEPLPIKTSGRRRGQTLKPALDTKGYPIFRLCVPGQRPKTVKVHRAVARAFIRPPVEAEQVNHKNGIKTDNRVDNLEYVSCKENIRHCWKNGLHGVGHVLGTNNSQAKLNENAVKTIRDSYPAITAKQLAEKFKVSAASIFNVLKGKTWAAKQCLRNY